MRQDLLPFKKTNFSTDFLYVGLPSTVGKKLQLGFVGSWHICHLGTAKLVNIFWDSSQYDEDGSNENCDLRIIF